MVTDIKKGDIVLVNLAGAMYSEQDKCRPVIVIQNDIGNKYSPTTIIIPLTSEMKKSNQPTHAVVYKKDAIGLREDSMALCEQIRTIDKRRIKEKIGQVSNQEVMKQIYKAYIANFGEI